MTQTLYEIEKTSRETNAGRAIPFGRDYEDFNIGDRFRHWPGKTITESDNNLFSLITMNHHPLHLDTAFAESSQHGRILVVGTLVFSLVVGLTVRDISGRAIANLGYDEVEHLGPVFVGDTIYAHSEVIDKRPSKTKPDRGLVTVITNACNQNNKPVLRFKRTILVPCRPGKEA
jgi:acyl dehydratase